jgi:hypothetical protein
VSFRIPAGDRVADGASVRRLESRDRGRAARCAGDQQDAEIIPAHVGERGIRSQAPGAALGGRQGPHGVSSFNHRRLLMTLVGPPGASAGRPRE